MSSGEGKEKGPPARRIRVILSSAGPVLVIMVSARRTAGPRLPGTACRLHEVHVGVIRLVAGELIAGGAVPADLDGSAARAVTRWAGLAGVPAPPAGGTGEPGGG